MKVIVFLMMSLWLINSSAQAQEGHNMNHGSTMATPTSTPAPMPTMPGQDAFGTIQEIVSILEADPTTDWAMVDISQLREHLVDMNQLTIDSSVQETRIEGGLEMIITGPGRTKSAIQSMVPAHVPMIDGVNGWVIKSELTENGAKLYATAKNAKETAHIRGLGFFGLMVSGSHHQSHHLGLAKGRNVHAR